MNLPLRFCVSCGRALSGKESTKLGGLKQIIRAGITKRLDHANAGGHFDRSRRSYGFERALRQFVLAAGYVAGIVMLYVLAMVYCMRDPQVSAIIHGLFLPKRDEAAVRSSGSLQSGNVYKAKSNEQEGAKGSSGIKKHLHKVKQ